MDLVTSTWLCPPCPDVVGLHPVSTLGFPPLPPLEQPALGAPRDQETLYQLSRFWRGKEPEEVEQTTPKITASF